MYFPQGYFLDTKFSKISVDITNSLKAPTKFVERSDLNWIMELLRATDVRKVLMNEAVNNSTITSRWTTLVTRQVNISYHLFWFIVSPLFHWWVICQRPKVSTPTYESDGDSSNLSLWKAAINCHGRLPLNLRHVTQYLILISDQKRPWHQQPSIYHNVGHPLSSVVLDETLVG